MAEVFRVINLPLCHVSPPPPPLLSPLTEDHPHPALCLLLPPPRLLCKLRPDGFLWGRMEIARLAPEKRAALICFKVKQVQTRFVSALSRCDAHTSPFRCGWRKSGSGVAFKAKTSVEGREECGGWTAQPALTAALANAVGSFKGILIAAICDLEALNTCSGFKLSCSVFCFQLRWGPAA